MELNQAMKILMELAESNMVEDPEMAEERAKQEDALATMQLHMDELEAPSPLQLVIEMEGGLTHQITSNVPAGVIIIDLDTCSASEDKLKVVPTFSKDVVYVDHPTVVCDPTFMATVVGEVANG